MVKILAATFDHRTSADSYAVHGQIRRPEEFFDTWTGQVMHPPARPNDREVVVPHRVSWPIPDELKPKSDAEIAARWSAEGRKGSPPPRPRISTVPLDSFGKEPEPPPGPAPLPENIAELVRPLPEQREIDPLGPKPPEPPEYFAAAAKVNEWPTLHNVADLVIDPVWQQMPPNHLVDIDSDKFLPVLEAAQAADQGKPIPADLPATVELLPIVETEFLSSGTSKTKVLGMVKSEAYPSDVDLPVVIIKGGKHAVVKGAAAIAAHKLKGGKQIAAFVYDHDAEEAKKKAELEKLEAEKLAAEEAAKKAKKSEAAKKGAATKKAKKLAAQQAAAQAFLAQQITVGAPEPKAVAADVLHEKVGEAAGSNKGGFFIGKDGVKRYVKFYDDRAQATGEHLANAIYRDLGIGAPRSQLFEHEGKLAYASEILEGQTLAKHGLTKDVAEKFMQGFAADVLTGNWDAAGTGKDNAFVTADGRVIRIDSGGTFLFRAKMGRKPEGVLDQISEWQKFFDPSVNRDYNEIAQKAGFSSPKKMGEALIGQIERIKALREKAGGWRKYIDSLVGDDMPESDRTRIARMLEERTKLLDEKIASLRPAERTKGTPEPARPAAKPINMFDDGRAVSSAMRTKMRQLDGDSSAARRFSNEVAERAGIPDAEIHMHEIRNVVSSWTSGYKDSPTQRAVYKAVEKIIAGEPPETPLERAVAQAAATRRERWKALHAVLGHEEDAPEFFDLHRGMSGEEFVIDVAKAWANDKEEQVKVKTYAVASWSHSVSKADSFATSTGVTFRWMHCPMESTYFDQAIDDATFLSVHHGEHEVIAGPGHNKGMLLPKHEQRVHYRGKTYTYEEREELLEQLRNEGKL
jgi:hypothetical protein